jgi:hypothetical protein
MLNLAEAGYDAPQSGHSTWEHPTWGEHLPPASSLPPDQEWRPNPGGSYIGVSQPDPPTPVPVPASAGKLSGSRPNGYPGPPDMYTGLTGVYPGSPNGYPGPASDFSGHPNSYQGPVGNSAPLPQTSQHQDAKFMLRPYNPVGPMSSSTPVHSTPIHTRMDTSQHLSASLLQYSDKFQVRFLVLIISYHVFSIDIRYTDAFIHEYF